MTAYLRSLERGAEELLQVLLVPRKPEYSVKCWDVVAAEGEFVAQLGGAECDVRVSQQWYFDEKGRFRPAAAANLCVTVDHDEGRRLRLTECGNSQWQRWIVGEARIRSAARETWVVQASERRVRVGEDLGVQRWYLVRAPLASWSDAALSALSVSGAELGFDISTFDCATSVPHSMREVVVDAVPRKPADEGGAPVERYKHRVGDGPWLTVADGASARTATVEGLANGTSYGFAVRAVSSAGWGEEALVSAEPLTIVAGLRDLDLSGVDIGEFRPETTEYAAAVPYGKTSTTVTATASEEDATVVIAPADADTNAAGHQVALAEGENRVEATVTAPDGETTQTYAVRVTREARAAVTLSAGVGPLLEGTSATFSVARSEALASSFTVMLTVAEDGAMLSADVSTSVTFEAGAREATLNVPTDDDAVVEPDSRVTVTLQAGDDYELGSAVSQSVLIVDNDAASFSVTVEPAELGEGRSATVSVSIDNEVTFADAPTVEIEVAGDVTASDYSLDPARLTLAEGSGSASATLTAVNDGGGCGTYAVGAGIRGQPDGRECGDDPGLGCAFEPAVVGGGGRASGCVVDGGVDAGVSAMAGRLWPPVAGELRLVGSYGLEHGRRGTRGDGGGVELSRRSHPSDTSGRSGDGPSACVLEQSPDRSAVGVGYGRRSGVGCGSGATACGVAAVHGRFVGRRRGGAVDPSRAAAVVPGDGGTLGDHRGR